MFVNNHLILLPLKDYETHQQIDDYFLNLYSDIKIKKHAKINTESPAWALDRLSILQLKIYHMNEEASRISSTKENKTI